MTNLALAVSCEGSNLDGKQLMSSREIADITGKRHDHVMRDIEVTIKKILAVPEMGFAYKTSTYMVSGQLRKYKEYLLPRRECEIVILGYDIVRRAAVIDRWFELETKQQQVALPTTYLAALEKLVEAEKEKLVLTDQRNEAIRTKAMIGDRKTATAMATASNLSRKVKKLEAQLQDVGSHMSLLAAHLPDHVETELKPKVQTWRLLKMLSGEMNLPTQEVADPRFGKVKTYHINVINEFKERYL